MIDWLETKKLVDLDELTATNKDKVAVKCDICGEIRKIVKSIIKRMNNTLCSSCRNKENRIKYSNSYANSDVKRSDTLSKIMLSKWSDRAYRDKQII